MATDRLEQLLADADEAAPPPAHHIGLATRVRRRAAQRSTNARIAAGLLIALGIAGIILWTVSRQRIQVSKGPTAAPTQEVQPEQSAEVRQRFAIELIRLRQESRKAAAVKAALLEPDAVEQVNAARERAAMILVADANRLWRSRDSRGEAISNYRQVIRLFPHTFAASQAAEKLEQLQDQPVENQQS